MGRVNREEALAENSAIPVVVLSRQQDPVETINSTLRNAGHAVHCTWVRDLADLADALTPPRVPQLLFFCVPDDDELDAAMEQRARLASRVPTLIVRDDLTEADLVRAIELGAQDVVTLQAHGAAAGSRGPRTRRGATRSRAERHARLGSPVSRPDARVHDGLDRCDRARAGRHRRRRRTRPGASCSAARTRVSWLGQPLMDLFDAAQARRAQGRARRGGAGPLGRARAERRRVTPDGGTLPLELTLERFEFDGEPAVRLRVATQKRDIETLAQQLEEALRRDMRTGLLRRAAFVEAATAAPSQPLKGGLRAIAYLAPDRVEELERDHGPLLAEDILDALGRLVEAQLQPGDLASRVAAHGFGLLFERGNARDQEAWLARLLERIAGEPIAGGRREGHAHLQRRLCAAARRRASRCRSRSTRRSTAQRAAAAAGGNRHEHRDPGRHEAADRRSRPGLGQRRSSRR